MNQLALHLPLSRRTDPVSSHDAADRAKQFRAKHEALIYDVMVNGSRNGLTAKELAILLAPRLTYIQIARRLSAMGYRGLIARREIGCPGMYERRAGCAVWRIL